MPRPPKPERAPPKLWEYELPGGWVVLAGRSERENDHLSIKLAKPNDWWFHVKGLSGSHVVLRVPSGEEPDRDSCLFTPSQLEQKTVSLVQPHAGGTFTYRTPRPYRSWRAAGRRRRLRAQSSGRLSAILGPP